MLFFSCLVSFAIFWLWTWSHYCLPPASLSISKYVMRWKREFRMWSQEALIWLMTDSRAGRWDKTASVCWIRQMLCEEQLWPCWDHMQSEATHFSPWPRPCHTHTHILKIGYSYASQQMTQEAVTFDPEVTDPNFSPPLTECWTLACLLGLCKYTAWASRHVSALLWGQPTGKRSIVETFWKIAEVKFYFICQKRAH